MVEILLWLSLALSISGVHRPGNDADARIDQVQERKTPVIECYPDGCCYEMKSRTLWSCEA